MKMTSCLWLSLLGLALIATASNAAPSDLEQAEDEHAQLDPDGVPLAVTQGQTKKPSQADVDAFRKQQEEIEQNKNWLLRTYEQQKQHQITSAAKDQGDNLYYQLSTNKELAKLAGLPTVDDTNTSLHTGATPQGSGNTALRKDSTEEAASSSSGFKPLISPLSSAPISSITAPLPISMPSLSSNFLPPEISSTPKADPVRDASDLDTPGMIAARKDPLGDTTSSDLDLDVLPGESIQQAREHQDSNLELALPMDSDRLHQEQSESLKVPGVPSAPKPVAAAKPQQQPTPAPVKNTPEDDPNAPMPVTQIPQINPIRSPIPSPFDLDSR